VTECVTLKELASPKPSAFEFYTMRPRDAWAWTAEGKYTAGLKDLLEIPIYINGRKFYHHNKTCTDKNSRTAYEAPIDASTRKPEENERNATMELVPPETKFVFDVFFEGISMRQLRELMWLLAIGENEPGGSMWHKIGHGKPIGLGSAKIVVNSFEVRTVSIVDEASPATYQVKTSGTDDLKELFNFDSDFGKNPFVSGTLENENNSHANLIKDHEYGFVGDMLKMLDSRTTENLRVSYPLGSDTTVRDANANASHQWFTGNRAIEEGDMKRKVRHVLPPLFKDDLRLPKMEKR
jgi:hypothetical protein